MSNFNHCIDKANKFLSQMENENRYIWNSFYSERAEKYLWESFNHIKNKKQENKLEKMLDKFKQYTGREIK